MAGETFTNFASTTLASPSPLTSGGTSFSVASGNGSLFPSANFLLTLDAEIILITSRSGDSFIIGARGYDGTVASSHSVGARVQLSICAENLRRLWQNVPDTYAPIVPPLQQPGGLTPSVWDNEWENAGGWTLYPASAGTGSTWNANTSIRSSLLMDRALGDNRLYTAYIAFNPPASTAYLVTAKVSGSSSFTGVQNNNAQVQCYLKISDQTNPTSALDAGNQFRVKVELAANTANEGANYPLLRTATIFGQYNASGVANTLLPALPISCGLPIYARISFDGANTYTAYVGDGLVYWPIAQKNSLGFTPQSLALSFANYFPSGSGFPGTFAVDYIRVVTGVSHGQFGF